MNHGSQVNHPIGGSSSEPHPATLGRETRVRRVDEAAGDQGDRMRRNRHDNRRRTGAGTTGPATRIERQAYTAEQREAMQQGLRILARIIARAHLKARALGGDEEPRGWQAGE